MYIFRFAILLSLFFSSLWVYADSGIAQFVFTTEPQSVVPNVSSGQITIEAQDSLNSPIKGNTVCLHVTSSSGTGEFSTNGENWGEEPTRTLALTLSTNQYRRNFYYKDSVVGLYTITVQAGLRPPDITCPSWSPENGVEWTAAQTIAVGSGEIGQSEEGSGGEVSSTEEPVSSAHVSEPKKTISVDAGPVKQTAIAGASTAFTGIVYGLQGELVSDARYLWNFGDGSTQEGKSVAHAYAYPGEYIVVLEGSSGGYAAGDKILVTVIPADISINSIGEPDDFFISLKNDTKHEINLEGWVLRSGSLHFMIPENTRIASGKTVKFSPQITKLSYNPSVSLLFPNGNIASTYTPNNQVALAPSHVPVVLQNIQKVNGVATEAVPVLEEPSQYVEEEDLMAAVGGNDTNDPISYWLFALIGMLAIAFGAFYFIFQNTKVSEQEAVSVADEFTIIEEK